MVGEVYPDWTAVYRDNVDRIYRVMYAKVGNRPDAEDLTAEVFAAALRPLRVSASVGEVRAYLLAAARTVLAGYWRRTLGREVTTLDETIEAVFEEPTGAVAGRGPHRRDPRRAARELPAHPGATVPRLLHRGGGRRRDGYQHGQREGAATSGPAPRGAGGAGGEPMTGRALRRYVEDLLHGRRPRGFAATDDDVATLQAAITLQAARPGADAPRAEFVDALQQRLAAEFEDAPPLRTAAWGIGRRGLLAGGAAVAAASAAIGVVIDRTLLTGRATAEPRTR